MSEECAVPALPSTKPQPQPPPKSQPGAQPARAREIGGPSGPEPTRYGDWERNGRCTDF